MKMRKIASLFAMFSLRDPIRCGVAVSTALLDDIPACAFTLLTGDFDVDYC
jgi:hypothetical protein